MALRLALAAGLLAVSLATHSSDATVADGQAAYDAGRFDDARTAWAAAAEAGDPAAQAGLGLLYDLGQGVPKDPAMAYGWYRRAAESGLALAQFNVAVMLDSGVGVARDAAQAATWYAKAAARGHGRAQYNLAQLYASGDGVPQNTAVARVWYQAAADGGIAAARSKLNALADSGETAAALVPVAPVAPAPTEPIAARERPATIELVWTAPAQPKPVRFFVQVLAGDQPGWRELYAGYVAQTATLVRLDATATDYAWRAYAVAEGDTHYAAGPWSRFTLR